MSSDRGSVSIVLAAGILVVLMMTLGVADLVRVLAVRSQARTAADAAALAAAQELALPSGMEPSTLAADYAAANGGTLVSCACVTGTWEVIVEIEIAIGDLRLVPGSTVVRARARAIVELPASEGGGT
jgi:secretion/DNA translocation related TadE-like protein